MAEIVNSLEGAAVVSGGGGQLVAAGVVWTLGARGGDGMAPIMRNRVELPGARAVRLLWRDGVIYAQHAVGGWTRFDGQGWRPVPDSGRDAPARPAAPAAAQSEPVCVVCGEKAERVIDGRPYCGRHRGGDRIAEVPITPCAIEGCGSPAVAKVGGRELCAYHAPRAA